MPGEYIRGVGLYRAKEIKRRMLGAVEQLVKQKQLGKISLLQKNFNRITIESNIADMGVLQWLKKFLSPEYRFHLCRLDSSL